jgi:hypothetical protein
MKVETWVFLCKFSERHTRFIRIYESVLKLPDYLKSQRRVRDDSFHLKGWMDAKAPNSCQKAEAHGH